MFKKSFFKAKKRKKNTEYSYAAVIKNNHESATILPF